MAVKNLTKWEAPSGTGYFSQSGGLGITTLSGVQLTTLSGVSLVTDTNVYTPKYASKWTPSTKSDTKWIPSYVINAGTFNLTDNSGNFLVDNSGNFLVTTPTYQTPKNPSLWTESIS